MVNFILGILAGGFLVGTVAVVVLVSKMTSLITEMLTIIKTIYIELNKTQQMVQATMEASENFVDALSEATKEYEGNMMHPRSMIQMFRSEDGRHVAPTFEGLIEKMKNDPSYKQMTDKDIEELKKMFEENLSEDDDDDSDNQKEPWQRKD